MEALKVSLKLKQSAKSRKVLQFER